MRNLCSGEIKNIISKVSIEEDFDTTVFSKSLRQQDTNIYKDSNSREVLKLFRQYNQLRFLVNPETGNYYLRNAHTLNHDGAVDPLGLGEIGSGFLDRLDKDTLYLYKEYTERYAKRMSLFLLEYIIM